MRKRVKREERKRNRVTETGRTRKEKSGRKKDQKLSFDHAIAIFLLNARRKKYYTEKHYAAKFITYTQ